MNQEYISGIIFFIVVTGLLWMYTSFQRKRILEQEWKGEIIDKKSSGASRGRTNKSFYYVVKTDSGNIIEVPFYRASAGNLAIGGVFGMQMPEEFKIGDRLEKKKGEEVYKNI